LRGQKKGGEKESIRRRGILRRVRDIEFAGRKKGSPSLWDGGGKKQSIRGEVITSWKEKKKKIFFEVKGGKHKKGKKSRY